MKASHQQVKKHFLFQTVFRKWDCKKNSQGVASNFSVLIFHPACIFENYRRQSDCNGLNWSWNNIIIFLSLCFWRCWNRWKTVHSINDIMKEYFPIWVLLALYCSSRDSWFPLISGLCTLLSILSHWPVRSLKHTRIFFSCVSSAIPRRLLQHYSDGELLSDLNLTCSFETI